MPSMKSLFAFLGAVSLAGTAAAQTDTQLKQCNGNDPGLAILGCTAVIQSRDATPKMLSNGYLNRGRAYQQRGQADRAIADLDQAVKIDPKNSRAVANRGDYYASAGDY